MATSYTELATRLVANAAVLDFEHNFKEMSRPYNGSSVEDIRAALISDVKALHNMVLGPAQVLREVCWSVRAAPPPSTPV